LTTKPTCYAIDFGTSNSLLAAASKDRLFDPAPLDPGASDPSVLRTALYFLDLESAEFGSQAVRALVDNGFRGRLIRSIKRHLPSRSFTATRIGHRTVSIEDLIGAFLRAMRERADAHYGATVKRVVLGRPARFSNDPADDQLAEDRLAEAARRAGFEEVSFCPEPVAAAYDFADELDRPRLMLVADLGGGTSDYTVVRIGRAGFAPDDVLAVGGVAVAGDALDGALVKAAAAPFFGSEARYRVPFGKNDLDMPLSLVELLASPADLTLVDRARTLRLLETILTGLTDPGDRAKVDRFIALVDDGLGFLLYEAIEGAKRRLSDASETVLDVRDPSMAFQTPVTRERLQQFAEGPKGAIVASLARTLETAGISGDAVEILCLTGGTSRVPFVADALAARVPAARVRTLRSFHSVVSGLAVHARERERER
jgi:hypothetical chaperone protein